MTVANAAMNYGCNLCGHVASLHFGCCPVCRSIGTARATSEAPSRAKFMTRGAMIAKADQRKEKEQRPKSSVLDDWVPVPSEEAITVPVRPAIPTLPVKAIQISSDLVLPPDIATETLAVLAKRGSGKTYFACVLAEEFARLGLPLVIIDPVGAMWGLSKNESGDGPGIDIDIWGGEHETEEQIEVIDGEKFARIAVTSGRTKPMLLDLSNLRRAEQTIFACRFFEELYALKNPKVNRTPLHLMIDEADLFAPQSTVDDRGKQMLVALEDVVRRGRSRGLGGTFITQRPSVLHKNILSQTQILVALRMTAPQDRDAIDEWIRTNGDEYQRAELISSLPKLERGEAWFWSPGLKSEDAPDGYFKRVRIRTRRTFDSSATPRVVLASPSIEESQEDSLSFSGEDDTLDPDQPHMEDT